MPNVRRAAAYLWVVISLLGGAAVAADVQSAGCFRGAAAAGITPGQLITPSSQVVRVALTQSMCAASNTGSLPSVVLRISGAGLTGADLFYPSSSNNCTHISFPLVLPPQLSEGKYAVLLQCGVRTLSVRQGLTIVAPPTVSFGASSVMIPANGSSALLAVVLSGRPQVPLSVRTQVDDDSVKVEPAVLRWAPQDITPRSLKVSLSRAPAGPQANVQLVLLTGDSSGTINDTAASAAVLVDSPQWSVAASKGFYRAARPAPVQLSVSVSGTGSSSWPSRVRYQVLVLPSSRPVPARCQQQVSAEGEEEGGSCSSVELAAAWNLTASGELSVPPQKKGSSAAQELKVTVPLTWSKVPAEAELHLGLWLQPLSNARVASELDSVVGVVYGTPLGTCPPGTSQRRTSAAHPDQARYSSTAPLQELELLTGTAADSNSSTSSSSSGLKAGSNATAAAAAGLVDLDPPFRPMIGTYTALLPPGTGNMQLALASNRRGDRVFLRADGCQQLDNTGWTVDWANSSSTSSSSNGGEQMWRARYNITALQRPCWLRLYVFTSSGAASANSSAATTTSSSNGSVTQLDSSANSMAPDVGPAGSDGNSSSSSGNVSADDAAAAAAAAAAAGAAMDTSNLVLYRSYSIRLVPLHSERQLSLRSLSFVNNSTTVIACGVPSRLAHLFDDSGQYLGSSSSSGSRGSGQATGSLPQPLVPYSTQQVLAGYISLQEVALATSGSSGSSNSSGSNASGLSGSSSSSGGSLAQGGSSRQPPGPGWQQQFTLLDRWTGRVVKWTRFTPGACSTERYLLTPLPQVTPDMRLVPELWDPSVNDTVQILTTELMVLLGGSKKGNKLQGSDVGDNGSDTVSDTSTSSSSSDSSSSREGVSDSSGCTTSADSSSGQGSECGRSSGSSGSSSTAKLPGVVAELPVITSADEGRSSKTYTLLLYNNDTAAQQLQQQMVSAPAAAEANGSSDALRPRGGQQLTDGSVDWSEASPDQLVAALAAARPPDWPQAPSDNLNCSVCINGTYSTRTNMPDCQVCPPGKFAATLLSTSCRDCPPGSFSHYWGAARCRPCLPGTFAYSGGAVYCQICPDGRTTSGQGAHLCDVDVKSAIAVGSTSAEYIILLSFGVVLDGTNLASVSRATTGINGSSEGIVAVLVQGDTAAALNVSLHAVEINAVRQINARQLLVNVSATVPVDSQRAALQASKELSADELVQRLIDDPDTFLRTTQTLGAESASITDLTAHNVHLQHSWVQSRLHTVLWPTLFATLLVLVTLVCSCWHWRWRRRHQRQLLLQGSRLTNAAGQLLSGRHSNSSSSAAVLPGGSSSSSSGGAGSASKSRSRMGWRWRFFMQEWKFRVKIEWWSAEEASPPSSPPLRRPQSQLLYDDTPYSTRLRSKQAALAAGGLELSPSTKSSLHGAWGQRHAGETSADVDSNTGPGAGGR